MSASHAMVRSGAGQAAGPSVAACPSPVFLVLEGLDGCGKSTTARALAAELDAELLSTPGEVLSGVRGTIESAFAHAPLARKLFYAASVVAASERVRANLEAGRSTVLDRYWLSTLAYADALGEPAPLEAIERRLLVPTATVFLDAGIEVRRRRMASRRAVSLGDRQSLDATFARRLVDAYRRHSLRWSGRPLLEVDVSASTVDDTVLRLMEGLR